MTLRTRNFSGNETCYLCRDGLAEIGSRHEGTGLVAMFAPCPFCEQGARLEFPERGRPWWGADGYWRGQDPDITPPPPPTVLLSRTENAMRMRLLNARQAGNPGADPLVGLELPERERFVVLSAAVKALAT